MFRSFGSTNQTVAQKLCLSVVRTLEAITSGMRAQYKDGNITLEFKDLSTRRT